MECLGIRFNRGKTDALAAKDATGQLCHAARCPAYPRGNQFSALAARIFANENERLCHFEQGAECCLSTFLQLTMLCHIATDAESSDKFTFIVAHRRSTHA